MDSANKVTLIENMKEALSVEIIIISLEKRLQIEERKSMKVTFKKESSKGPFRTWKSSKGVKDHVKWNGWNQ